MTKLNRSDVVGHEVRAVLQSPWVIDTSDRPWIKLCRIYAKLSNSIVVELLSDEYFADQRATGEAEGLIEADFLVAIGDCVGATVLDVVVSDLSPSVSLRLSNGMLLTKSVAGDEVGGCVVRWSDYAEDFWSFHWPADL